MCLTLNLNNHTIDCGWMCLMGLALVGFFGSEPFLWYNCWMPFYSQCDSVWRFLSFVPAVLCEKHILFCYCHSLCMTTDCLHVYCQMREENSTVLTHRALLSRSLQDESCSQCLVALLLKWFVDQEQYHHVFNSKLELENSFKPSLCCTLCFYSSSCGGSAQAYSTPLALSGSRPIGLCL